MQWYQNQNIKHLRFIQCKSRSDFQQNATSSSLILSCEGMDLIVNSRKIFLCKNYKFYFKHMYITCTGYNLLNKEIYSQKLKNYLWFNWIFSMVCTKEACFVYHRNKAITFYLICFLLQFRIRTKKLFPWETIQIRIVTIYIISYGRSPFFVKVFQFICNLQNFSQY